MDIKEILKLKLKTARKLKNLTQEQVAQQIGVDLNYYGKIENGKNIPSFKVLLKLRDLLEFTLDDLINPEEFCKDYYTVEDMLKKLDKRDLKILESIMITMLQNPNK